MLSFQTGKVFVLDSGFCVLDALIQLKQCGVFAHALIKKRRYWPKYVPGDSIIQDFADKEVGYSNAKKGVLNGVPFHLYAMKEPDYTMLLMSTYGTNATVGEEKKRHYNKDGQKKVTTFVYPEVVHNHYCYRDVIDNHNSARMHPISMEETWMTTRWPNRVFCFLLAVTIVNVQNAGCYFTKLPKIDTLQARKFIAQQLIHNKHMSEKEQVVQTPTSESSRRSTRQSSEHCLTTLPTYKKFKNLRIVKCKSKYQKWQCKCKAARVRSYCKCSPGVIRCVECYATHRIDSEMQDLLGT